MNKSISAISLATFLALSSAPALADQLKTKVTALPVAQATALQGKTVAVVLHERESFVAMTPGKAVFGMLGVAGMVKAGNDFVGENEIADPTLLIRDQLANTLRDRYGVVLLPADKQVTASVKPADLTKAHEDSDYILSVRHRGSNYSYYPGTWGGYWVGNVVNIQLIETRSGKVVSKGNCYASTHKNEVRPTLEQLRANRAQLTKDILTSLAWKCTRQLAIEAFHVSPEAAPAIPTEFEDPSARVKNVAAAADAPPPTRNAIPEIGAEPAPAVDKTKDGDDDTEAAQPPES